MKADLAFSWSHWWNLNLVWILIFNYNESTHNSNCVEFVQKTIPFHFTQHFHSIHIFNTFEIIYYQAFHGALCVMCGVLKEVKKVNIFSGFFSFIFWSHPPTQSLPSFSCMRDFEWEWNEPRRQESSKKNRMKSIYFTHSSRFSRRCCY